MSATVEVSTPTDLSLEFHHIHVYVERDSLRPLADYKKLESQLNALASRGSFDPFSGGMRFLPAGALPARVEEGRQIWNQLVDPADRRDEAEYASAGQDFVEQLLVGLGWRVTAEYVGPTTRSVLVTSADPCGVKFCVTCALVGGDDADEPYDHFRRSHVERFLTAHGGRPGIAALGFEVAEEGGVEAILAQYRKRHPALLVWHTGAHAGAPSSDVTTGKRARVDCALAYTDVRKVQAPAASSAAAAKPAAELELGRMRIGEAFAFYTADGAAADDGTVLRFVERAGTFASSPGFANPEGVLPGLADAAPVFDGTSIPAYSDHWASSVLEAAL